MIAGPIEAVFGCEQCVPVSRTGVGVLSRVGVTWAVEGSDGEQEK